MSEVISNRGLRDDEKHEKMETPEMEGEESIGGSMPNPESDDDVTEMEHKQGLYLDEDENTPQEADLEGELKKTEEKTTNS